MASEIFNVVVGTAGHIDHGKSSIVRTLTGIDPDRLKEEQERGLTIDLGFASWVLPDGRRVGLVDVPGHERFVKNMVAGATGIDLVILVVAADDGVMPQTREHLEIMQLLGLKRGLVALSKIDLVDPELLEIVEEDTREFLQGTFLADAPILPISVVTKQGLEALEATLAQMVTEAPPRDTEGIFRMPIQRVFSAKGHGTVVTGIPISGSVAPGDVLEVLPLGKTGRVRGIQAYKQPAERAHAGHSTALNIGDLDYREVHRGMMVATQGYLSADTLFEARLTYLASARKPLRNHTAIRFHTGTAETLGRIYLLEGDELAPGTEALVQFKLEEPIVAAAGDRFVIRLHSPMVTIGGGLLVGASDYRLKRKRSWIVEQVQQKEQTLDSPAERAEVLLREVGVRLMAADELRKALQLPRETFDPLLAELEQKGAALRVHGSKLIHGDEVTRRGEQLLVNLKAFHEANPRKLFAEAIDLRNAMRLEPQVFDLILRTLAAREQLVREGSKVQLAGRQMKLSKAEDELYQSMTIVFADAKFQTPRLDQLAEQLDTTIAKLEPLVALACERGDLFKIADKVWLARDNYHYALRTVVENIQRDGELVSGPFRDQLETTRKYVIPLLDHFDRIGLTVREGSQRILRREHAKVMARELGES